MTVDYTTATGIVLGTSALALGTVGSLCGSQLAQDTGCPSLPRGYGLVFMVVGYGSLVPVLACIVAAMVDAHKSRRESIALLSKRQYTVFYRGECISARLAVYVYVGHFLSCWTSGLWQYAVPFLLGKLAPAAPVMLLPLTSAAGLVPIMPLLAQYVDATDRWRLVRATVVTGPVLSAFGAMCMTGLASADAEPWLQALALGGTCLCGALVGAVRNLHTLALEKDWVIELALVSQTPLAAWNITLRQIDLATRLVAPIAFSALLGVAVDSASPWRLWLAVVVLWQVFLTPLRLATLRDVYVLCPALQAKTLSITAEFSSAQYGALAAAFVRHPTCLVAVSSGLLAMTVLCDGHRATAAYLAQRGLLPWDLGGLGGAAMGLGGTLAFPWLLSCLHPVEKLGLGAVWWYLATLLPVGLLCVHAASALGDRLLVASVAVSQAARLCTDLAQLQTMQEWVESDRRGAINGLQTTVKAACCLVMLLVETALGSPDKFHLLVGLSIATTAVAAIVFTRWYALYV
ncbi:Ferroportin (FP) Family [Achlya hypogyna]|uniref:Solute carrier family 40 member n=1 Tax=Achlya hypogyna TaxID=1202772 RepID=A0A1V9YBG8_ACHHY|nr:Ferroportin (FP) Family [Achlya hypogyna]